MDPALQTAMDNCHVLSDATRAKIVEAGDTLTPDNVQQIIKLLEAAEAKHEQIVADANAKKKAINEKYVQDVHEFLKHGIPKLMKKIEEADKASEEKELDGILTQLDNL